jgi:hypothetical protein
MTCREMRWTMATAILVSLTGCMGTAEDFDQTTSEDTEIPEVESTRISLRAGVAVASPDEFDGYGSNGVGLYLSAIADRAELTLYVVAPAESAVFDHPVLRLTTQQGDSQTTEIVEFDSVALSAGESRVLAKQADGRLEQVVADVAVP